MPAAIFWWLRGRRFGFAWAGELGLGQPKGEVPCPPQHCGGAGGPSAPEGGRAPRRKPDGDVALLPCCLAAYRAHLKRARRRWLAFRNGQPRDPGPTVSDPVGRGRWGAQKGPRGLVAPGERRSRLSWTERFGPLRIQAQGVRRTPRGGLRRVGPAPRRLEAGLRPVY